MNTLKVFCAALLAASAIGLNAYAAEYAVILKEPEQAKNAEVSELCPTIHLAPSYEAGAAAFSKDNISSIFLNEEINMLLPPVNEDISEIASLSEEIAAYPDGANDEKYYNQWYLPHIKVTAAWKKSLTGDGVKVGIIDTGINLAHVDLIGKTTDKFNCIDGSDNVLDTYGHGSMVSGIIAANTNNTYCISSIADDVDLAVIKTVENASSSFKIANLATAIQKAIYFECDVVNISLGWIPTSETVGFKEIERLINEGTEKGMIFVASAGNISEGVAEDTKFYPAAFDNVISVSALGREKTDSDSDDLPTAIYSGTSSDTIILIDEPSVKNVHNDKIDCAAPGFKILSTYYSSQSNTAVSNGTSFAAPMVSAAAAIAKQLDPTINHERFYNYIKLSARDVYTQGYDEYTGYGALDIEKLIEVIEADIADPTPEPTLPPEKISDFSVTYTKDQNKYTIDAIHSESKTDITLIAAAYCNGRLVTVKSRKEYAGSEGTRFSFTCDEAIDSFSFMIWTPDGIYPLADRFTMEAQ